MFARPHAVRRGRRKRQINGGIPRITLVTIDEAPTPTKERLSKDSGDNEDNAGKHNDDNDDNQNEVKAEKKLTIVVGCTAPSWADQCLKQWATSCRQKDMQEYNPKEYDRLRSGRESALKQLQEAQQDWQTERLVEEVSTFRRDNELGDWNQGRPGIAIAFPGFASRKRCVVCLCTTQFKIAAEDGLALPDAVDSTKGFDMIERHRVSCAELEAAIVWLTLGKS